MNPLPITAFSVLGMLWVISLPTYLRAEERDRIERRLREIGADSISIFKEDEGGFRIVIYSNADKVLGEISMEPKDVRVSVRSLSIDDKRLTAGSLKVLERFPELRSFWMQNICKKMSLEPFEKLEWLEVLMLDGNGIDLESLSALKKLRKLRQVSLSDKAISDKHLDCLRNSAELTALHLGGTSISDTAIPELLRLRKLEIVELVDTKVTADGAKRLKAGLPHVLVFWGTSEGAQMIVP